MDVANNDDDNHNEPPVLSPVLKLHSTWMKAKLSVKEAYDFGPFKQEVKEFLGDLTSRPACVDIKEWKKPVACQCLKEHALSDEEQDQVADHLQNYALLHQEEMDLKLRDWMLYAASFATMAAHCQSLTEDNGTSPRLCFVLPGLKGKQVCRNVMARLLGYGWKSWKKICKCMKTGTVPVHSLKGCVGVNADKCAPEFHVLMKEFFERTALTALPRATRVVAGLVTEENVARSDVRDADVKELPASVTKRSLHARFLHDNGWVVKLDSISRVISLGKGDNAGEEVPDKVPKWLSFLQFWKRNYPKIVVQRPREDICNECFICANRHKCLTSQEKADDDSDDDDDDDDISIDSEFEGGIAEGLSGDDLKEEKKFQQCLARESPMMKASHHVTMARQQREYFRMKKEEAKADINKPKQERCVTYVGDYCQNLSLPHFGEEQPGGVYCYSPLNVCTFGLVDCAEVPSKLTAYYHLEGQVKKGGNTVCSFIWKELERKGSLPPDSDIPADWVPLKELNLFFDGCTGQNKNRMVLRFIVALVLKKVARVVRANFLVRGHTKNDCDRLFNILKLRHRKLNTYIPQDLHVTLNTHEDVMAIKAEDDFFLDWDGAQTNCMEQPMAISANHIFSVYDTDPSKLWRQEYHGGPAEVSQRIIKKFYLDQPNAQCWKYPITEPYFETVKELADIRWVELFTKFRKYIPIDKRSQWKYYNEDPGSDIRKRVKADSKKEKELRKNRAKRTAEALSDVANLPTNK